MNHTIVIFASGSGTNAQRIVEYFADYTNINIVSIFCNNPNAYVIERAAKMKIPCQLFSKDDFLSGKVLSDLELYNPSLIVLAGFLWLIPPQMVKAFPDRIINIHPALLPKYGGKGMYGMRVHESVIENCETESGITIHLVNEKYDEGNVLFQAKCVVNEFDTPDDLAEKIHQLEYEHFPKVIEKLLIEEGQNTEN
jgi:phosphoribosylglycinamide formyltransferase-1